MKRLGIMLTVASLLIATLTVRAGDEEIEHLIPPGYEPEEARDEQGLWLEFDEIETAINKSALLVKDPELNNYVNKIMCRVAVTYCEDFRVYLIRNPDFNASMTATGMMQVWTGLIVRASSSDEIAAVIAHEISHYTRLHSLEGFRAMKRKMATGAFFDVALGAMTGIYGIGQASAALSYLSFSREQETEADLLGAKLLIRASYDPHASYRIWQAIIDEDAEAVAKREQPGVFSRTHPSSDARVRYLKSWVGARFGPPDAEQVPDAELVDVLNHSYLFLMEDQIDTNRFGRTRQILDRHLAMGVEPSLVRYFYGEMFRQRAEPGDSELAMSAYRYSIEGGKPPPEAYKNLGYLHLKKSEIENARMYFRDYLKLDPDATDRAMIEYYLED